MAFGVLIVDDNPLFLEAARDLLEQGGLRVVGVAATSAEALQQAQQLRPGVVLVDIILGGESGFALARRLASQHPDGGPAVILISTYSQADFAGPIAESPATGFCRSGTCQLKRSGKSSMVTGQEGRAPRASRSDGPESGRAGSCRGRAG